ncbi:hypothetical protein CEXT_298271 [Caerostris extrusa]|uniref:Uncharacterized protein n=1 Tax=Caerostris extrusa TaxID=172846 RepID=A0AAV4WZ99_CAEEX|nr:hypothetical protein CEXT_298271 [Caerostris extrusa]
MVSRDNKSSTVYKSSTTHPLQYIAFKLDVPPPVSHLIYVNNTTIIHLCQCVKDYETSMSIFSQSPIHLYQCVKETLGSVQKLKNNEVSIVNGFKETTRVPLCTKVPRLIHCNI